MKDDCRNAVGDAFCDVASDASHDAAAAPRITAEGDSPILEEAGSYAAAKGDVGFVSSFSAYVTLLRKDFMLEFQTKELVGSMGLYAILVLIVFGAAVSQTGPGFEIERIAAGLLWTMIVFTSLLGLNRSFQHEKENDCLDGLMLIPFDRSVIFLAKATANLLFLLVVEAVTVPLFFLLFMGSASLAPSAWLIVLPLLVGTVGIAGIGTMLSTMTVNTRGRDVLLSILFIPLSFPLLYSCVSATAALLLGAQGFGDVACTSLLVGAGYDVAMILISWVLYDFVVSA